MTRESFSLATLLLGWSDRIVVATGIACINSRDATAAACGSRTLEEAYPGRFLLGLGVSHAPSVIQRGGIYRRPVAMMRAYLDAMDEASHPPSAGARPPCVLAALGPLMLKLAGERTDGAHPYFVTPEHTAFARRQLGPDRFLAPDQKVIIETDPARARQIARGQCAFYLGADNYRANLRRLGFDDADFENGGSDRLIDAVVAWGDIETIRDRVKAHFDAGADHVAVQVLADRADRIDLDGYAELAPALADL